MKKIVAAAIAVLLISGCQRQSEMYDKDASEKQLIDECKDFGGKLQTYRYNFNSGVVNSPWVGTCINLSTGNRFSVYVKGVLK